MAKNLSELLALLPDVQVQGSTNINIETLVYDSRQVKPGALFICLVGEKVDGHDYILQAQTAGAVAVVVEKDVPVTPGLTMIRVANTRIAMQVIAPYFFDYPGKKLRMIGVTGTNGKTTTTHIIRDILMQAGYKVGLIGTIHTLIGERSLPVRNTTPDVVDLQATLAQMVASNIDYVVMEVSSHALALGRIAGCEFDTGVFTNLTRDHLDFHGTFENYIAAKAKLFDLLSSPDNVKGSKAAIINVDDPAASSMLASASCAKITYGIHNEATLTALSPEIEPRGVRFTLKYKNSAIPLKLKITGMFNVYNTLAAVGAMLAENISLDIIKTALENFESVPGRFELVDVGQPFSVIVDYAHTPDGLENILRTAKQFAKGRIIVVFGCGGDRDRTKRPIMGKLAAEYGDVVIATSDNPRTEDPVFILQEVEVGIKQGLTRGATYEVIVDRRQAIAKAIEMAETDDIVIIAGKGHETYQILKNKTVPFDDRQVARELIREMRS
jgi:UDP-N-acetylmuramyl-tripeptide synthetase